MIITLTADHTSIIAGETVTLTTFATGSFDVFPLVFGPGTFYFVNTSFDLASGDGQSVAGASLNTVASFTYLNAGTYVPFVNGSITVGAENPSNFSYCMQCAGITTGILAQGPTITVSVPEPATAALMAIAMLAVMLRSISRSVFR